MGKIVKLRPYVSETIWGGAQLAKLKKLDSINPIGETWEVSSLDKGSSSFGSVQLKDIASLNYLTKFIDTAKNLSIQVHPDDEYAKEHENSKGKTECWLIMDAADDAGIYLGFKPGITKKEFFNAVENGVAIDHFLNFYSVKPGDFFYIPAGTIHAIGSNVTLCEIQQSSGVTYRVWDWNRVGLDGKPRELHIEKSKDVTNFSEDFNQKLKTLMKKDLFREEGTFDLVSHEDFKVNMYNYKNKDVTLNLEEKNSVMVLKGRLAGDIELGAYESAFVLEAGSFELKTQGEVSFLVISE